MRKDADLEMDRARLLQMLEVTTIGRNRHEGSQALGEVCHRLVDVLEEDLPYMYKTSCCVDH